MIYEMADDFYGDDLIVDDVKTVHLEQCDDDYVSLLITTNEGEIVNVCINGDDVKWRVV